MYFSLKGKRRVVSASSVLTDEHLLASKNIARENCKMLVCSLREWFSLSMARKMDYNIGREKCLFAMF